MEEAPSPAPEPALWYWDYLDRCFARHRVCISFGLWICASSSATNAWQRVFTGAYLAAIDLVSFVSILFPVCGSKFKSNSGRSSQERKKRQRLRASVFALALPLSLGPGWALWTAVPKASGPIRGPQRRLLGSLLQDNTEIFGYLLGSIAAFGSWASRIPPLSRICRGKTFPSIHLWTRLLSALAGLLYASAIVAHDRRPEYLLRATPWFLTSLGRAALDLAIIFLSWVMKSKMRQALGFASEARGNPDTQALLTCVEKEEESQEARTEARSQLDECGAHQSLCAAGAGANSDWMPLIALPHCKPLKRMAAISRYMELTIEPVQQVIRARVSSSSSSQASSINSDLEQKYWEALNLEQIRLYSDYLLGARNEFIKQTADMFGSP
ncbi:Transmembrane protein 44 [Camelus dromedarius]|uniref:Transmembrane protein 44 n=1 Tax=Camelus dromedarius TaxID=9838 RepID=A0A5N4EJM9_CAMDR|nr:Transmembrane protein 44 [Camelus dromedarius]